MTPEQQNQHDLAIVKRFAEALGEHFDTVQIFVTRHESGTYGGTLNINYGVGNWPARYGQVSHWMLKQNEGIRLEAQDDHLMQ